MGFNKEDFDKEYAEFLAAEKAKNSENDPEEVAKAWATMRLEQEEAMEKYVLYLRSIKDAPIGSNIEVVSAAQVPFTLPKKEDKN